MTQEDVNAAVNIVRQLLNEDFKDLLEIKNRVVELRGKPIGRSRTDDNSWGRFAIMYLGRTKVGASKSEMSAANGRIGIRQESISYGIKQMSKELGVILQTKKRDQLSYRESSIDLAEKILQEDLQTKGEIDSRMYELTQDNIPKILKAGYNKLYSERKILFTAYNRNLGMSPSDISFLTHVNPDSISEGISDIESTLEERRISLPDAVPINAYASKLFLNIIQDLTEKPTKDEIDSSFQNKSKMTTKEANTKTRENYVVRHRDCLFLAYNEGLNCGAYKINKLTGHEISKITCGFQRMRKDLANYLQFLKSRSPSNLNSQ